MAVVRLCAKDYAEKYNIPLKTLRRLCRLGKIPCIKIGRKYLINVAKANIYFENLEKQREDKRKIQVIRPKMKTSTLSFEERLNNFRSEFLGCR
ncbi:MULTISPECIES: helix-turn-helix domain-containing protein [Megamonas]|uniref:helix-turn-helix domain-containing protein n=1 Tax=Megamonas TaxID=158846 RepID=UPI002057CDAD|nr:MULTISPECIES: helix-turn-helix domain-containing protein [Megamonas]DAE88708.1 MAG TPA: helix-turn-helix domain protein [Caudoviricetes sp.]